MRDNMTIVEAAEKAVEIIEAEIEAGAFFPYTEHLRIIKEVIEKEKQKKCCVRRD